MTLDILWADATLESVTYGYDEARLVVRYSEGNPGWALSGQTRVVVASGPIGIRHLGLWDEVIIERATLSSGHPFAAECWAAIERTGGDQSDSGSPARNRRQFQTLEVVLQDETVLQIAAADFRVELR